MTIDIEALRQAALAASAASDPEHTWERSGNVVFQLEHAGWRKGREELRNRVFIAVHHSPSLTDDQTEEFAEFIAAANPSVILKLIERLELAEAGSFGGYIIEHADGKRWRTIDSIGMPDWTDDRAKALAFSLREHADTFAAEDPEDVRIVAVVRARSGQ